MNKISVKGIKIYSNHGCLEEEAKIGGNYIIDVEMLTDFSEAAKTDDLTKTIDYVKVNKIVEEEMKIRSKLIETVGYRIVNKLKSEFSSLEKVIVTVFKINPPINGIVDNVSITIEG